MSIKRTDVWERLLRRRVIAADGCWIAQVGSNNRGYRYISVGGKAGRKVYAHRLAYEKFVGALDPTLTIDHLCRNRSCFNPEHLQQIGRGANVLRGDTTSGRNARKTHCKAGHPFAGTNLKMTPAGRRVCISCRSIERKRKYDLDPQAANLRRTERRRRAAR